ncbi:ankyrin repeat domain-containing protein [Paenalcaligenes faecalis]|uniref:ankyrin repeat domain-containing protein n=1 Tax=Paenalcaligenes faecalis TaxID=2980099 RepID=UPI0022B95527|nr:ankyrin repeat domain-containing protein [Paenalcaligenes faecalis]
MNNNDDKAINAVFSLIEGGLTNQLTDALQAQPELVNAVSDKKLTVFETLLDAGYTKVASEVLSIAEFDVNHSRHHPLRAAIATGNIDLAFTLLEKGASPNYRPEGISSALLLCLENEYFELAEAMVRFGAEVDIRNHAGWTPLIWASMKGRFKAVQFLLNHGANIHACNNGGWNAVTGAYYKKHTNIVELLLDKGAVFGEKYAAAALLTAYDNGYLDIVEYLLKDMKINPNITDDKDISLLAKAVSKGDWPIVKLLLEKGANPNVFDDAGLPLLAALASNGNDELIAFFLHKGADIHLCSSDGVTAIYAAASYNHYSTLEYLLEKGANINIQKESGWTPLMIAAKAGYKEVIELLLKHGANTQLVTKKGLTAKAIARHYAPKNRNQQMIDSAYSDIVKKLTLPKHLIDG